MPLIALVGAEYEYNMGNLKTYTMTLFTKLDHDNKRKIYANYSLFGMDYTKVLTLNELLDIVENQRDITICLDEFHTIWDCYSRPTKKDGTKSLHTLIRQVRKRRTKLYYTAQSIMDIPLSVRKMTQYIYQLRKLHTDFSVCCKDECRKPHIQEITPIFLGGDNYMHGTSKYFPVNTDVFDMYDSEELIGLCDNIF